jgi:hypothetical protein
VKRIRIAAHLRGATRAPSGDPPQSNPQARTILIDALDSDGSLTNRATRRLGGLEGTRPHR